MNKYSLIILAFAATTWTACGTSNTNDEHHDHMMNDSTHMMNDSTHMMNGSTGTNSSKEMAYACPMHPEVTGKEGDKCSKCGMYLEPVK
ncbi:MAG: heavy metal-binding domain-containing protein [Flavobacteriales bacterium]